MERAWCNVWRDGEVLARDAAESDILDALGDRKSSSARRSAGMGFVFGRGTAASPAVTVSVTSKSSSRGGI